MSKKRSWWIGLPFVLMLIAVVAVGMACGGAAEEPDEPEVSEPAEDDETATPEVLETDTGESKGKITIVEQDWDGQLVLTSVVHILLEEEMGYEVDQKFAPADSVPMFIGLETGDFHFVCCNWPSYSAHLLEEYVDTKGSVERLGLVGINGSSGWFVPTYVIEGDTERGIEAAAPTLRSWEQLDEYGEIFATADTRGKGRLVEIVPAWDTRPAERLEAFGADYEVVFSGSEAASFAELGAYYERGDPILLFLWHPHWAHAKWQLTEIQMPPWTEECYPAGEQFDCGWPGDPVAKLVWPGLEEAFPEVYQFLSNFQMTNDQQNEMVLKVAEGGMTPQDAAQQWIDANESVWRAWIP